MVELEANPCRGECRVLGAQIRGQLVDDISVAARLQLSLDDPLGVGLSGIADKPEYPYADHPVVRTHPVTGRKALYVNSGFTRYINGIPRDESDGILRYLYQHMANPLFQCRFRWQENSIAFWDNRCVQHHAMWDYWPHTRSGHRVTLKGDRPV